uniref:Uncharacterized protein MANES_07G113300 n=1 Tax=Rhizophora mucronata TaxID=61149 RepID=A0A2P2M7X2_RHIMU
MSEGNKVHEFMGSDSISFDSESFLSDLVYSTGKDIFSSNVKPSNGKSFEKSRLPSKYTNRGWHAPSGGNNNLVISFSDNDSASESEDNRQEMASGVKRNTANGYGKQRLPSLSSSKTSNLHKNARIVNKVTPKKLSLNRKFVSSISGSNRVAHSKGSGPSLIEQGPQIRNVYTINKTTASHPRGSDQGTGLDSTKLQDLRQQIALREQELKIRAAQQTRESVSVSARDHGAVNLCRDASKKSVLMAVDAAVPNPREPEKKRLKVSGSYSTQLNLDYPPGRFVEKSTTPVQKEALANSSLVDRNIPDFRKKAIPNSRVQSSMVKLQKQDDNQPVISPQDLTCSNINDNCSQSIKSGMQVDPSVILSQATPLTFMNSSTLPKNIASPNNVSQQNFLGSTNVAEHRRDIRSLVEMEESLDKELEEAQEHRRKCEIEERNALKAYRRAQRDLIEANTLCTELYHKRELYSTQFRSFVINDSSLLWSSRQHEYVGMASNVPNNASKNSDLVLNSSHQMQPESDGFSQPGDDTYISGAPLDTLYQQMNGQNLGSEPCSEPDASMSEPLPCNSNNGANRESTPSNDPNISAEEDEETSPLDNEVVQRNFKNKQTGQNSLGEQRESHKLNNSIDGSQDSLVLEATLRSELFARLRMRTIMKNSGLSNVETADNLGTENDNGSERTQASNSSLPFSEAEKNQEYDFEGNDKAKRDNSEVPFQVQSHEMNSVQFHSAAHSEDGGYSVGGYQLKTAAVLCPPLVVRSVFGCIKEMFPMNPFRLQRVKNKHDKPSDNVLEEGVCFNSDEIQHRKGIDDSVEETVREICGQEIGSYFYSAAIDPSWPLCMYELRGKCNNDDCPWQHARDFFNQNVGRHQNESASADCQVGLSSCSQEHDDAKGPSKFCCPLTPPTYLVGLDALKAEPYSRESIVARKKGQFWQKFFSICLASSSLPLAADEPFLNGNNSRIEVHGSWNRQSSYFQSRNSMVDHVNQGVPSNVQALEMALLIVNQEVNNLESTKKCLSVLSRAIEVDPTSEILWIVYLLISYSQNVSIGKDDMFSYAVFYQDYIFLWCSVELLCS